jgi:hypothetical protein
MRRKYKNEIFHLLLSSKYGIDKFEMKEKEQLSADSLFGDKIEVKNTPLFFVIRNAKESFELFDYYFNRYAPDFPISGAFPPQGFMSFDKVKEGLKNWLDNTLNEYLTDQQEPDLWEEFKTGNKTINLNEIDFENQSSFSFEEKKQIELSLNELKFLIQTNLKTTKEEQEIVNKRLDYLIEASKRLNKFDWKGLALSTLFSISIALSLDTEQGHLLFELFKKVFAIVKSLIG